MITKTLYDAFKYLKYWREHGMVCDFEVTDSCLCILDTSKSRQTGHTPLSWFVIAAYFSFYL